uniref:hypothetical protein n=1 Tax=Treponema endosymbiont of Eucomonympha sp. TaxID=1580831 RepID=UPI000AEFCF1B
MEGNGFSGGQEPSDLWVSYDDNQNGLPDDSWYGVERHGSAQKTVIGRYAVTWLHGGNTNMDMTSTPHRQLYWADSKGRVGATVMGWPKDWGAPDAAGTHITYTGNLVSDDDRIDVGYYGGAVGGEDHYLTASNVHQWNDTPAGFTEISFCRVHTSIFRFGGRFGENAAEGLYADGLGQQTDFPRPEQP